jgi:phenylacetic acid degradation operon negative regulatory protein
MEADMAAGQALAGAGPGPPDAGPVSDSPPRLTRRHTAGGETARGLLFTVLGEFVLPSGGSAWTSAFIDVLGRLGVEEKACRQALMRTAADGWLIADRAGRRASWRLTSQGVQLLTEGTERIYGFTASRTAWDGRWLMILARTPETERQARHRLRTRLAWTGFGSPAPGVWLSPDPALRPEAERILADAGLLADAHIFLAAHAGGGQLAALIGQAWDLGAIERRYEDFLTEFEDGGTADPLARQTELVHAWRRFPWLDPVLPAPLLPAGWSGTRAAALFARLHARWSDAAMTEWQRITD